jgi:hypothetical protein
MLYWECKRRVELIYHFRTLAFTYFQNIQYPGWTVGRDVPPTMNQQAQSARAEMNLRLTEVELAVDSMGISRTVKWTPPPLIGGYIQYVDLVGNIFDLWRFEIPHTMVFDALDRAIGEGQRREKKLFRSLFNPFYWAGLLIVAVLRLPFRLLGAAGFNAAKAEQSLFGKLVKLSVGLTLGLAAIIPAVAALIDHPNMVKVLREALAKAWHHL